MSKPAIDVQLSVEVKGATPLGLIENMKKTLAHLEAATVKTEVKPKTKKAKQEEPEEDESDFGLDEVEEVEVELVDDEEESDEDEEDEDESPELTLEDDIIPACKKNKEKARKLLKKYKASTARELKKSDYAAFLKALK